MHFKRAILALAVVAVTAVSASFFSHPRVEEVDLLSSTNADVIDDHYIVVFKDGVKPEAETFRSHFAWLTNFITLANTRDGNDFNTITHIYENAVLGYAGRFKKEVLEHIRRSDDIAFIEKDSVMYASEVEKRAPWGLARISHREPLSFGNFDKYIYDPNGGEGVTAYVVDTGININHEDFESRAVWGKNMVDDNIENDGNGHGTHVAGTIAGKRFGVAKKVRVVAIKVLDSNGSGSTSNVIRGIDYTLQAHREETAQAARSGTKFKGSVANMSLGGGLSRALNLAVDTATLMSRIDSIRRLGFVPRYMIAPILEICSPSQLRRIEQYNPEIVPEDEELWKRHCIKSFNLVQLEQSPSDQKGADLETSGPPVTSWRKLYFQKEEEEERRAREIFEKTQQKIDRLKQDQRAHKIRLIDRPIDHRRISQGTKRTSGTYVTRGPSYNSLSIIEKARIEAKAMYSGVLPKNKAPAMLHVPATSALGMTFVKCRVFAAVLLPDSIVPTSPIRVLTDAVR
ncbi:proteinase B [Spiromyces aspiralis]|uniref:Proteinase B n=1 Tax=Spiromyces aspiralis TaxID=68401 RepID=A0ACC1HZ26_9FUNG|nr:proteinase B [Spiromyces aspiralis]